MSAPCIAVPRIAIVPDWLSCVANFTHRPAYLLRCDYLTALATHGALPLVVAYQESLVEQYLDLCQGIVFIGGDHTVDPALFGQDNQAKLPLNPTRVDAEMRLFHAAFDRKMPILGICAGMQLMNVLLGGSLIQDLPSQRPHALDHKAPQGHPITVCSHTRFWHAVGQPIGPYHVNTSHRQAVDRLGMDVRAAAIAPDGIIEAIESTTHPFCMGVQWHPELSVAPHPDDNLWNAFVQACMAFGTPHAHPA